MRPVLSKSAGQMSVIRILSIFPDILIVVLRAHAENIGILAECNNNPALPVAAELIPQLAWMAARKRGYPWTNSPCAWTATSGKSASRSTPPSRFKPAPGGCPRLRAVDSTATGTPRSNSSGSSKARWPSRPTARASRFSRGEGVYLAGNTLHSGWLEHAADCEYQVVRIDPSLLGGLAGTRLFGDFVQPQLLDPRLAFLHLKRERAVAGRSARSGRYLPDGDRRAGAGLGA
jgi:hypothetical protein